MPRKRSPNERPELDSNAQPSDRESTKRASGERRWAAAKTKSGKSPTGSKADAVSAIERLIDAKDWATSWSSIQEELIFRPTDHWLWFTLSLTFYEERQYAKALACSRRAVELAPSCPLALWHYAGSLYMTEQADSAFAIWTVLLNMNSDEIAYGDHGEGMDQALQLINDVQYRLARFYQWSGKPDLAREAFTKYLHNRRHGVGSILRRAGGGGVRSCAGMTQRSLFGGRIEGSVARPSGTPSTAPKTKA